MFRARLALFYFDRRPKTRRSISFPITQPSIYFYATDMFFLRRHCRRRRGTRTANSRRTRSPRFLRNRLGVFPSSSRRTRFSRVNASRSVAYRITVRFLPNEMYTPALMKRRQRYGVATLSVSRSVSPVSYRSCSSYGDHRPESADYGHSRGGLFEHLRRHNLQVPSFRVRVTSVDESIQSSSALLIPYRPSSWRGTKTQGTG